MFIFPSDSHLFTQLGFEFQISALSKTGSIRFTQYNYFDISIYIHTLKLNLVKCINFNVKITEHKNAVFLFSTSFASHQWLYHRTTGKKHLSLKFQLSVCHDVKVFQVQVDVVEFLTACRGHVPHHDKGPILQNWTCCSKRGLEVGVERISMDGVLWLGCIGEGKEGKEKEEGKR